MLGYIWVTEKENVKVIELEVINLTVIHVRKLIKIHTLTPTNTLV